MKPFTLVGVSGNAFSVMGYVTNAMRTAKMSAAERDIYRSLAMSGDYNNLLYISCEMIDKVNKKLEEQGMLDEYDDGDDYDYDYEY